MFDELIDTISTVFTITVIIVIICVIVGIAKAIQQSQEQAERLQKQREENQKLINQITLDSKRFPTSVLISQRDEMLEAYNELYSCKQRGALKRKELLPLFRVGDDLGCSVDLETSYAIWKILDDEIKRRQG